MIITHEWEGEPHASPSIKKVNGVEDSKNILHANSHRVWESSTPSTSYDPETGVYYLTGGRSGVQTDRRLLSSSTNYYISFWIRKLSGTVNRVAGHFIWAQNDGEIEVVMDGVSGVSNWNSRWGDTSLNDNEPHLFELYVKTRSDGWETGTYGDFAFYIQPNRSNYIYPFEAELWGFMIQEEPKRYIPDYWDGDTPDYSTNPPLLYHNGEWQEYTPKVYI